MRITKSAQTRGGQAEFKWSNVVTDKDREVKHCPGQDVSLTDPSLQNYLGHSVLAPAGRWQSKSCSAQPVSYYLTKPDLPENKDVNWYNKEQQSGSDARAQELKKIKQAEEDALAVAL